MNISLVIPTWNAGALLEDVLAAVDAQRGADTLERVAIDSGSTDGTVTRLERHGFTVHGIAQRDFNHGTTRDRAIGMTTGDVVVLLTQDATPADDRWLDALVACYDDPQVGAAYCRQIPRPDCNPFIKRRLEEWTAGRMEPVTQRATPDEFAAMEPMQRLQTCAYDNVAGSVRRSTWETHRFGHRQFGEDVAFGKRLVLSGHAIAYTPDSAVIHSHNRSPREEGRRIYCDHQNLRDLFDIHLLPTRDACKGGIEWALGEYAGVVDGLELDDAARAELHAWARGYAFWATVGMYLGANSRANIDGPRGEHYRRIDRWMHRGI